MEARTFSDDSKQQNYDYPRRIRFTYLGKFKYMFITSVFAKFELKKPSG